MKVLHLALVSPDNDGTIDRGFRERGHEVERIDWQRMGPGSNAQARRMAKWADLCFFQGQGTTTITTATLDHLRANGVFVVSFTGDVRNDVEWYAAMAPHVDLTLFTNGTDIEMMRSLGHKADYLQVGYDDRLFNLGEVKHERKGGSFLGNHYGSRFPQSGFRKEMVERMKAEFGDEFIYYGSGWGEGVMHAPPRKEIEIYRRTLLAIGADHYIRPYFASDRLLRSQAGGAMVLQQQYPGMAEEHPHVVGWDTLDELVEKYRYYLGRPEEAIAIGLNQARHVQENCRWPSRIEQLERILLKYR
jgi:hypothetical protein